MESLIVPLVIFGIKEIPEVKALIQSWFETGVEPTEQQIAELHQAIAARKAAEARVFGTA